MDMDWTRKATQQKSMKKSAKVIDMDNWIQLGPCNIRNYNILSIDFNALRKILVHQKHFLAP